MDSMKWLLNKRFTGYSTIEKKLSERMSRLASLLSSDVGTDSEFFKPTFEELLAGRYDHFATNTSDIERVNDQYVKICDLYDDEPDYETRGLVIDREQLYYLMDEWARLSREQVNEITITYDDGKYTIEGR